MALTYGRPWQNVNLDVGVDALDIVDSVEKIRWSVVDVEVAERGIAGNIIVGVVCSSGVHET